MYLKVLDGGSSAKLFRKSHSLGKLTVTDVCGEDIDCGDYWLSSLEPLLRETDAAIPSYREAIILTGRKDLGGI
jgi:hypothetical protein